MSIERFCKFWGMHMWNIMSMCIENILYTAKNIFTDKVMTSYSSNCFTLLLLCTSTPLVLCGDRLDCGSRQIKRELVTWQRQIMTYHFVSKFHQSPVQHSDYTVTGKSRFSHVDNWRQQGDCTVDEL